MTKIMNDETKANKLASFRGDHMLNSPETNKLASFRCIGDDALGDLVTFAVVKITDELVKYVHYTPDTVLWMEVPRNPYYYDSRDDIDSMIDVVRDSDDWVEIPKGVMS